MKVTFLLPGSGIGGGCRAVMEFANGLLSLGHTVRIFYKEGQPVSLTKRIYRSLKYGRSTNWLDSFRGSIEKYGERLDSSSFSPGEIVVSFCSQTTLDAWRLPETVKKVFHCHGAEYENWDRFMAAVSLPVSKIAISNHVKRVIEKYSDAKGLEVIPNGIHHSEYYADDSVERKGVGGCVRYSHSKDSVTTIKVFSELRKQLSGIPLYSFGDGKNEKQLKLVYTHNPTVEQGRRIYNSCKVWFLSSLQEGFGLPILEAMACGCVVVSTLCGGPADLIQDGHNGFLVEVGNYGGVVYKIKQILEDNEMQMQMAKNAINSAKEYSWDKSSKELERALKKIEIGGVN
jgi:glycosyltransferase involved in cell wall biosynthesis